MKKELIQQFVVDRTMEILHKETLDSYRIRYHNAYTSLVEARDTIIRWNEGKVKTFDTVKYLGMECISLLKKDDIMKYDILNKTVFIKELEEYLKTSGSKNPTQVQNEWIINVIENCITNNKDIYAKQLLLKLESLFEEDELDDSRIIPCLDVIDSCLSSLFVQLIFKGYSKQYLYLTLNNCKESFDAFLKKIHNLIASYKNEYNVVWKVRIHNSNNSTESSDDKLLNKMGLSKECVIYNLLSDELKVRYKKFFSTIPGHYYYEEKVKAYDIYAAMKNSREHLMTLFDRINLGYYESALTIPDNAIVCKKMKGGWFLKTVPSNYFMDGFYSRNLSISEDCYNSLYIIERNSQIDDNVKTRLKSAIRHLNYGDMNPELEQRFINYWLALEYIFATPNALEPTYSRLKDNLINVLASSYIKRNTDYVENIIKKRGYYSNDKVSLFSDVKVVDNVMKNSQMPLILFYKLSKLKSHLFTHKDKRNEFYKNHIINLERHITRIYNIRNILIHEGAIKQDMENVTSNLRYYLVFMLDQMIAYFKDIQSVKATDNKRYTLNDYFNQYKKYRLMIEYEYSLPAFLSVPVTRFLW